MSWILVRTGSAAVSASATTLTPTISGPNSGIRIAICSVKSNAVITTATAGWTKLFQQDSTASFTVAVFIGTTAAANPVFTWTGAVACSAIQAEYGNLAEEENVTSIGASNINSGTGTNYSSSSISSTRRSSLALYITAIDVSGSAVPTPSGWTEDFDSGNATAGIRYAFGNKPLPLLADTSGAISIAAASGNWVQAQIELQVKNFGSEFQFDSINFDTMTEPELGLNFSSINFDVLAIRSAFRRCFPLFVNDL